MKMASNLTAIVSLVAANLVPLIGVGYFGWNISSIMLLYWAESAIIGYFAIKKMRYLDAHGLQTKPESEENSSELSAHPNQTPSPQVSFSRITINGRTFTSTQEMNQAALGSLFFIPFFVLHYGIFMLVHLIFLMVFFFSQGLDWWGIALGFVSLFFSHYVSYQTNFINAGEYKRTTVPAEMFKPYPRIIVMHMTIILGAFFVLSQGGQTQALVLLVVFKTIVDLGSHLAMHKARAGMIVHAHAGRGTASVSIEPTSPK
jgi:hypothetical protein